MKKASPGEVLDKRYQMDTRAGEVLGEVYLTRILWTGEVWCQGRGATR